MYKETTLGVFTLGGICSRQKHQSPWGNVSVSAYTTLKKNNQTGSQSVKSTSQIHLTDSAKLISMHFHQAFVIRIETLNPLLICWPFSCVLFKRGSRITPLACNALNPVGINIHIAKLKDYVSLLIFLHYNDMSLQWCDEKLKNCYLQCASSHPTF